MVARWIRSAAALGLALLCACTQHSASPLPAPEVPAAEYVSPQASPPPCKGQQTHTMYAALKQALSPKGGKLCIPAFAGFGGDIPYTSPSPLVTLTLTTSTTNYNHKMPPFGKGLPLVYLQVAFSGGTVFAQKPVGSGGMESQKIVPGKKYTRMAAYYINGKLVKTTPCYTAALKGTYGGIITLQFANESVPEALTYIVEFYSGIQAKIAC